jgi:hypothetical protein
MPLNSDDPNFARAILRDDIDTLATEYRRLERLLVEIRDWFFGEVRAGDEDLIMWVDRINDELGEP